MIPEIADQISHGERLVLDAQMVGDAEDHRLWQIRRATWISHAVRTLEPAVTSDTLSNFVSTVTRYAGGKHYGESLPIELEGLREGLAMLTLIDGDSHGPPTN